MSDDMRKELSELLNRYSQENGSNTPDFILTQYLTYCLVAFNQATKQRDAWYNIAPSPGHAHDSADPTLNY